MTHVRRLEQWLIYVRWFGVLFGIVAVAIEPNYPDVMTQVSAWTMIGVLAAGNLAIWGALGRIQPDGDYKTLNVASFLFDAVVIMSLVWIYAFEQPYVTWALLILIPMEGALRFRLKGALIGAAIVAVFFIPQSLRRADLTEQAFDIGSYVFMVGFSTLVAGITGSMANSWHAQNEAFRAQSLKLAELDELKDRFLAVTSHEIRGPLTAIIAGVETVWKRSEQLATDEKNQMLEIVSVQSRNLARLVDDLLVTSQLQAGKMGLQIEWADLQETISGAVQGAASRRREHRLELFVEPLRCEVDAARIGQMVRNLVENAYKYTPARTRVTVASREEEGGVLIEVADEGPGIPAEHKDKLFEAFGRIEEIAAGEEGVGLGLFVVSQLVAAMEGHIDLVSSSAGASFTLHIPCRTAPVEQRRLGLVRDDEASG
jgi:signal transduction histidine kinase